MGGTRLLERPDTDIGSSYRTTLNQRETLNDEDEKEHFLKACHKRCADRTLKVLEKNGGIFIKLGQHLVGMAKLVRTRSTLC